MGNITGLGYQGLTIDEYTQQLAEQNTQTVVDVRLTPISRKPGFSKTRLKNHLEKHGINYVHLRELGNPKENRDGFWDTPGTGPHTRCVNRFCDIITSDPEKMRALQEVIYLAESGNVVLLCYEEKPVNCHRNVLLEIISGQC